MMLEKQNYQLLTERIYTWIHDSMISAGFHKCIIALSGGIDSAVCAALAVRAIKAENVHIVLLPYGILNPNGVKDAKLVIQTQHIPEDNVITINIKKTVDTIIRSNHIHTALRKGNVMARVRMIYLFDLAKKLNVLVCGTENKSEHFLGYFTRFGDEASDIEPIRHLYKTQVWELAKFLQLPSRVIEKQPSAGLWKGQTDEKDFGFTYRDADQILSYYFDQHLSLVEIVKLGFSEKVVLTIVERVARYSFKHKLPYLFTK